MSIGIDISSWQQNIDIDAVLPNIDFLIIKATEGYRYTNPHLYKWFSTARQSDKPIGLYHFAGNVLINDPIKEANNFLDSTCSFIGDFFPVLDVEVGRGSAAIGDWVSKWCRQVSSQLNCKVIIYTNPDFLVEKNGLSELCNGSNLWLASWGPNNGKMNKMPDRPFLIWQYTSRGKIPGYDNEVDLNFCAPDVNLKSYYSSNAKSFNVAESFLIDNGIFEGYGDGEYGFNDSMTREQFAWALYRYHQKFGVGK